MKGRFTKSLYAAAAAIALSLGLCVNARAAQTITSTPLVVSTQATGTSAILALQGQLSSCTINAVDTAGGASITVYGNTSGYGPLAVPPPVPNPNFGSNGVIAVTTSQAVTVGSIANAPSGFYFTWSGNTGTLTVQATCSAAVPGASLDSNGNLKVISQNSPLANPLPVAGTNVPTRKTQANAALSTCTSVSSVPTVWVNIVFRSTQTGTITLYDEGANPTCSGADTIEAYSATAAGNIPFPVNLPCTAGLAYQWTTAVEVGIVWIGTNP